MDYTRNQGWALKLRLQYINLKWPSCHALACLCSITSVRSLPEHSSSRRQHVPLLLLLGSTDCWPHLQIQWNQCSLFSTGFCLKMLTIIFRKKNAVIKFFSKVNNNKTMPMKITIDTRVPSLILVKWSLNVYDWIPIFLPFPPQAAIL